MAPPPSYSSVISLEIIIEGNMHALIILSHIIIMIAIVVIHPQNLMLHMQTEVTCKVATGKSKLLTFYADLTT